MGININADDDEDYYDDRDSSGDNYDYACDNRRNNGENGGGENRNYYDEQDNYGDD